ncbi:uracil phosphoribosyltransferase-domain-containing protein [Phaeosphaeriaceae sp. PMI808]|nr:uracil phosphoribosyltransferase-domain-containing protein [Phaeosphaeriaceae sp. PMI808]
MSNQTAYPHLLTTPHTVLKQKAIVVALYGLPGSGKTSLVNLLKQKLEKDNFAFYEGSGVIDAIVPGGLDAFQRLKEEEKEHWRKVAIDKVRNECTESGKVGVVAAHFMFWREEDKAGHVDIEMDTLRRLCRENGILFSSIISPNSLSVPEKVSILLQDFQQDNEQRNLTRAEARLDEVLTGQNQLETVLVLDADKTLAAVDTGKMFWKRVSESEEGPLKALFGGPLGYSYTAFRQADVAAEVTMHAGFVSLLHLATKQEHVGAMVITCGLRRVWEKVLEREGLSTAVSVLGGGRIADGFVVTAAVEAALVARLQDAHDLYVWAFGDSPLDLEMLGKADQAVVVSGEEKSRSQTMDMALTKAIDNGLQARQTLLPSNSTPRLNTVKLPLIQLAAPDIVSSILCHRRLQIYHATEKNAAKLLMTPMRDAARAGAVLRKAHGLVGWYLATEFLADIIGVEEYLVPHVQGHNTTGYRLLHEQKTSIVALMRGGEPMALGVNDALPLAMFIHANRPEDVKLHHLQNQSTVVLVDSVVNSGKSVVEFVQAIRKLHDTIRIVVVAGVVQDKSVFGGSLESLGRCGNLSVVALRLSNKFTGRGTTDTGNRLFNTTHLD